MATTADIQQVYQQAIGTENWYQHWTKRGYFTDGVKAIAEVAGAFWLIDAIFSHARMEEFQLWTLLVKDCKGVLTMREDSDSPPIVIQEVAYTDFPQGLWKFYLENDVVMLPEER